MDDSSINMHYELPHAINIHLPHRRSGVTLTFLSFIICITKFTVQKSESSKAKLEGVARNMAGAHGVLGKCYALFTHPTQTILSLMETGTRHFVTQSIDSFLSVGCVILIEEEGTVLTFDRMGKGCFLKCVLRIHRPEFYWKVMTRADLGLAAAYIQGDFTFVDKDKGLLNFILILIANRDWINPTTKVKKHRGWRKPFFFTAGIASMKYFLEHGTRKNTPTQAPRNISKHYDMSNELFSLFLGETMSYSCGIFKNENEDINTAQLRKFSLLMDKARIDKKHEVLELGCGWGSFGIEVVRQTGCKYTGITLSKEQLKMAEERVKDAGLQDKIEFRLCDYRQLPDTHKFDRIISCEMMEHVGHEYMEEYFGICESILAEDGLLVMQFTSIPDQRYDEVRQSCGFVEENIFPGACIPSLSRVTSAMATTSRLCVEHLENIGVHYYYTLRKWREKFLSKQSEIMALGFDEQFIRTWEYYFDYCAAGFKSYTLGNYQMVFSRPGNCATFNHPYKSWPSACWPSHDASYITLN